ncbi:hypothetical protein [Vannielia sp. SX4]|uniref:hypothetical protein n=1 Tax=Vannielia sp. SX4 TaxID=3463852 RepID=UPI004059ECC2
MEWKLATGLRSACRILRRSFGILSVFVVSPLVVTSPAPVAAQSAGAVVIGSDRGGFIRARLAELQRIKARGQRVEIRGKVCFSTCTMFLGADDVCVSPETTFGFHGPVMAIGRLSPAQFESLSRLIASHYPPAIADWYMAEGRMRTNGLYRMKGEVLIRHGVEACPKRAGSR